ncbi:MAG: nucleotide exchange factor GrpE [Patescibacteria group bacterium]
MVKKSLKSEKKDKTEDKDLEIENLKNQIRRTLADYQNLEKRVSLEREELKKSANSGLLLRLLPALDTLLLAEKHTQDEGLKLSVKQIFDILEKEGLKKIETKDAEFDPAVMEAVQITDGEEGKVAEELRAGYFLNDKVLRAAQVSVGHKTENS